MLLLAILTLSVFAVVAPVSTTGPGPVVPPDSPSAPRTQAAGGWSVQWTLGDMAQPLTAEGSVDDMAQGASHPNTPFLHALAFAHPDADGTVPACDVIERFEIDWYFGLSGSHDLQLLFSIDQAASGHPRPVNPWAFLSFMSPVSSPEAPRVEGALEVRRADDALTGFDARCDGPDHLRVSFAFDAVVEGEGRSIPIRIDTHGSAPIQSMGDY